jgi:predicted ATPase
MRGGLSDLRSVGTEGLRPHLLGLLASTYLGAGQTEPALEALMEAFDLVKRGGEHWCETELYRLEGELLRRQHGQDDAEAENCFTRALAIAEFQGAHSLVGRLRRTMQRT